MDLIRAEAYWYLEVLRAKAGHNFPSYTIDIVATDNRLKSSYILYIQFPWLNS